GHVRRIRVQVTPQYSPEQPASDNEPVAVAVELKTLGPFAFLVGECFGKGGQPGRRPLQAGAPDMNLAAAQLQVRGWKRPMKFRGASPGRRLMIGRHGSL